MLGIVCVALDEVEADAVLLFDPEKIKLVGGVLVERLPPYRVGLTSDLSS
jgi:hypothetical protein